MFVGRLQILFLSRGHIDPIVLIYNRKGILRIGGLELIREFRCFSVIPLDLKGMKHTVLLLYVINLFLVVGPPKITIRKIFTRAVIFHALSDEKVFPHSSDIGTK